MSIEKGEKICYNIDAIKEEVQSDGQVKATQNEKEVQSNEKVNPKSF